MELFKREKYLSKIRGFYDADDMIKVITGVRRCGKSCLMQTIMGELSANGVPADHLIYLNLDSRSYRHVQTAEVLDQLIASYASLPGASICSLMKSKMSASSSESLTVFVKTAIFPFSLRDRIPIF